MANLKTQEKPLFVSLSLSLSLSLFISFQLFLFSSLIAIDNFKNKPIQTNVDCKVDCCILDNWSVLFKGGIAPIVWLDKLHFVSLDCNGLSNNPCNKASFNHLAKLPWTIGFELDYRLNDCMQLYGDFQYRQANGRCNCNFSLALTSTAAGGSTATIQFSKYKSYSGYFGADYYLKNWCNTIFFAGIKIGFTHFPSLKMCGLVVFNNPEIIIPMDDFFLCFQKTTSFSGGGRIGADWNFYKCFSLVFLAEFIGQWGPKPNKHFFIFDEIETGIRPTRPCAEFIFPLEIGLKYSF